MGYKLTVPVLNALYEGSKACFVTDLVVANAYELGYVYLENDLGTFTISHNGVKHDLGLCKITATDIKVFLWHEMNDRTPAAIANAVRRAFDLHEVFYLLLSAKELINSEIGWLQDDIPFWYQNGILEIGPY